MVTITHSPTTQNIQTYKHTTSRLTLYFFFQNTHFSLFVSADIMEPTYCSYVKGCKTEANSHPITNRSSSSDWKGKRMCICHEPKRKIAKCAMSNKFPGVRTIQSSNAGACQVRLCIPVVEYLGLFEKKGK